MSRLESWKWCPRCRGGLVEAVPEGDEKERLVCGECGLVIYDNPAPCACAVVLRRGKVMLTKRAVEPSAGLWDLPGGYVEVGETPEQTLEREILEETGLRVRTVRLLGFFVDTYGDGGTDTLNISYEAEVTGGIEKPGSDVEAIAWFEPASLPPDDQLAFRNTREALAAWLADRSGKMEVSAGSASRGSGTQTDQGESA